MAHAFVSVERDQTLLLPPDLRAWLPPDHLAWMMLDAVDELDLAAFYIRYRTGAQGRAAYDPRMMVALMLYAYATGVRSSRDIERHLIEDVAFRVIAANRSIDHATICRFRDTHQEALGELFVQIVGLCVRAGLVKPTIVAIDGTKIKANAAVDRNVTEEQLKSLAAEVFEEAAALDAEEDRLYGDRRGDELPEHLIDRDARIEWLREQLAERKPTKRRGDKKINTTDPDSRIMKSQSGFVQGFNAQVAVTDDHIIVAADLTNDGADVSQLEPMIEQTGANLEAAGADQIDAIVADAGYLSRRNANLDIDGDLLVAPTSKNRLPHALEQHVAPPAQTDDRRLRPHHDDARRSQVMEAYVARDITASEAAAALVTTVATIYYWAWHLRRSGTLPSVLVVTPMPGPSATDIMLERLRDPAARAVYGRRAPIVEPVIGQLKEQRRLRAFLHRGLPACRCELRLVAAAQNLRKLWTNASDHSTWVLRPTCP